MSVSLPWKQIYVKVKLILISIYFTFDGHELSSLFLCAYTIIKQTTLYVNFCAIFEILD